MSAPLWLDAFPRTWQVAHEATVPGRVESVVYYPGASREGGSDGTWLRITPADGTQWTGVFSSDNLPGRLNVVASWPDPDVVMVAAGGDPYLVRADDPDTWSRLGRSTAHRLEPVGGLALVLDDEVLAAYDGRGLAWESEAVPGSTWLGVLDDDVHLRSGGLLHRVALRHGRTTTEAASW